MSHNVVMEGETTSLQRKQKCNINQVPHSVAAHIKMLYISCCVVRFRRLCKLYNQVMKFKVTTTI